MTHDFSTYASGRSDPGVGFRVVAPANADMPHHARALYVGTGGDVVVLGTDSDDAVTFKNVPSGVLLVGVFRQVRTATTATDLVAYI